MIMMADLAEILLVNGRLAEEPRPVSLLSSLHESAVLVRQSCTRGLSLAS